MHGSHTIIIRTQITACHYKTLTMSKLIGITKDKYKIMNIKQHTLFLSVFLLAMIYVRRSTHVKITRISLEGCLTLDKSANATSAF